MDATLDRLVSGAAASASAGAEFVPSRSWSGPRPGYYFGTSDLGTGYYLDRAGQPQAAKAAAGIAEPKKLKRPRDDDGGEDGDDGGGGRRSVRFGADRVKEIPSRSRPRTGEELLAEAEASLASSSSDGGAPTVSVVALTPAGVRSSSLSLRRAAERNELDRAKFPNEPEKFMESELVLNDAVISLKDVAAEVTLYSPLVESGAVGTLLGLLGHENGDLAASVLSVLAELLDVSLMTAPDADGSTAAYLGALANALVGGGALDLIGANLGRFDEEVEEERQGLDDALNVLEGLMDLDSAGVLRLGSERKVGAGGDGEEEEEGGEGGGEYRPVAEVVLARTAILTWLLERAGRGGGGGGKKSADSDVSTFAPIALHASEVLSSLLQRTDFASASSSSSPGGTARPSWNLSSLPPYKSAFDEGFGNLDSKPKAKEETNDANKAVVDGMECLLQSIAPYRRSDPNSEEEVEFLENVLDALAASLQRPANVRAFLDGQGVELMLRCLREGGHSGGGALRVLYFATSGPSASAASEGGGGTKDDGSGSGSGGGGDPYKESCEVLVSAGGLRTIFPLLMGRGSAIPRPAPCSDAGRGLAAASARKKKNGGGGGKNRNGGDDDGEEKMGKRARRAESARREWLRDAEGNAVRVVYGLTRHLDGNSPDEARDRLLTKFIEGDCEKCDRLVELALKYDGLTRLAEYRYYRSDEAERAEESGGDVDVDLAALNAKLAGGGDVLHRVCAVAAFASVGSRRCHEHILEQLEMKNSGIGVMKSSLEEFTLMLDDGPQKSQLRTYLSAL